MNRDTLGVNNLPRVVARIMPRSESNPRPLDHESNALPLHHRVPTGVYSAVRADQYVASHSAVIIIMLYLVVTVFLTDSLTIRAIDLLQQHCTLFIARSTLNTAFLTFLQSSARLKHLHGNAGQQV